MKSGHGDTKLNRRIKNRRDSTGSDSSGNGSTYDDEGYYSRGVYEDRYWGNTNLRDPRALLGLARRIFLKKINNNPDQEIVHLNFYDFGCGDGRYFNAVSNVAKEMDSLAQKYGKQLNFHYVGSDVSKDGISGLKESVRGLTNRDGSRIFKDVKKASSLMLKPRIKAQSRSLKLSQEAQEKGIEYNQFKSNLMKVTLIHNSPALSFDDLHDFVNSCCQSRSNPNGTITVAMPMYGVLSCIQDPNDDSLNRKLVTSYATSVRKHIDPEGSFFSTMPTMQRFKDEQESGKKAGTFKDGLIEYYRGDSGPYKYSLMTQQKIYNIFVENGLFNLVGDKIHVSHTDEETITTKDSARSRADYYISIDLIKPQDRENYVREYNSYKQTIARVLKFNGKTFEKHLQDLTEEKLAESLKEEERKITKLEQRLAELQNKPLEKVQKQEQLDAAKDNLKTLPEQFKSKKKAIILQLNNVSERIIVNKHPKGFKETILQLADERLIDKHNTSQEDLKDMALIQMTLSIQKNKYKRKVQPLLNIHQDAEKLEHLTKRYGELIDDVIECYTKGTIDAALKTTLKTLPTTVANFMIDKDNQTKSKIFFKKDLDIYEIVGKTLSSLELEPHLGESIEKIITDFAQHLKPSLVAKEIDELAQYYLVIAEPNKDAKLQQSPEPPPSSQVRNAQTFSSDGTTQEVPKPSLEEKSKTLVKSSHL